MCDGRHCPRLKLLGFSFEEVQNQFIQTDEPNCVFSGTEGHSWSQVSIQELCERPNLLVFRELSSLDYAQTHGVGNEKLCPNDPNISIELQHQTSKSDVLRIYCAASPIDSEELPPPFLR